MINNKEVKVECLKNAKSINISEADKTLSLNKGGMRVQNNSIVFIKNPDNSYNAVYTAKYKLDKQTNHALFNEEKRISPQFDGHISIPYLSPDANNVAYVVKDKKEWFVMMNDKKITRGYKEIKHTKVLKTVINEIVFCGSGDNVIYQAKIQGNWYVMKGDEIISEGFSEIKSITVNTVGNKIAYIAKSKKKWTAYINKRKISEEFDRFAEEIKFSPDGNSIAYAAGNEDSMFVMINSRKISPNFEIFYQNSDYMGKQPLAITNLTFNKAGDNVAYLVNYASGKGDLITNNLQHYVMINNTLVSPKMYSASVFSNKAGELIYAGIDISGLILHHVKIEF